MAAATEAGAAEVVAPPPAQTVGNAFVAQYYKILHHSPSLVHRFYQDISQLGRPEEDGSTSITTTMTAINEKVLSLHYDDYKAEIKSVDAQESLSSGVHVLVTGYMTGKDNIERNFTQSFFLAPQDRGGYFVLNDMFQYVDKVSIAESKTQAFSVEVEIPVTAEQEQVVTEAAPVEDDHITEQTNGVAEEANGEVHSPFENGKIVEATEEQEEEPVAEVVNAVPDDSQMVVEANVKTEEAPKKSYASIVKDLKVNSLPFSSPPPASRKTPSKSQEKKVNHAPPTVSSAEVSGAAPESGKSQDGEAEGYSIYIKGLPYDATPALLEDEFKKFGAIKNGGIQVRSKQGFCFGFVEFEEESAVHNAVKASPITLGGRPAVIEEKRSTNSRVTNRGRFPAGRGVGFRNEAGFRNEGMRGRGNYGGGRGYNRAEFSGRSEFSNNRGNNRGGSSNRGGGDGFQRTENSANGGRVTRGGGLSGSGAAKNLAPRVPASA
ncbi:nuclear transport factor 2 [Daucus carota subsp. sativus]|uniref:NTF2 domain-containing protein n=1 Tax=Daucus carota subsp. sativus TaxID=79200 RepID=A0A161Y3V9_DAUCS|nr:PREDICTED: putative G3BP-like protein [Daucus carota subsp. sativus]